MNVQHCKTLPTLTALAGLTLGFSAVDRAGADSFVEAASMRYIRASHTATLLRNGKVLVAGGWGGIRGESVDEFLNLKSAEIYDPVTDTWTRTGSLNVRRRGATAVLLADGKVLIAGGLEHNRGDGSADRAANSAEIYDPATGSWRLIRPMTVARSGGGWATLLPSGEVMVGVELYNPASGSWSEVRRGWESNRSYRSQPHVLPNGKVPSYGSYYDPGTETWTTIAGPDHVDNVYGSSMLLSGEVLALGNVFDGDEWTSAASIYDFRSGSWTPTGPMSYQRTLSVGNVYRVEPTLLPNGRVLVVGGIFLGDPGHSTSELYDPIRGIWRLGPSMNVERGYPTATLLRNGTVLVAGGTFRNGHTAELYVPDYRETAPSLNFLHSSNRILSFSWQGVGTLEESNNLTDWEVAPLQHNPQVIAIGSAAARFFRVNAGR